MSKNGKNAVLKWNKCLKMTKKQAFQADSLILPFKI